MSVLIVGSVVTLPSCSSVPLPASPAVNSTLRPGTIQQAQSRWVAVDWSELPGAGQDPLHEAWVAWLRSCEKPSAVWVAICADVRRMSIQDSAAQWTWMQQRLQPYRIESHQGAAQGLLTAYYEPALEGSRTPTAEFNVPLYQTPADFAQRKPWFTRQQIDTLPEAQNALRGRAIVYLANPVDAQILQIQGSGKVRLVQADGSTRWLRLGFAGSNEQSFRSIGRWLQEQGLVRDASWAGIKTWLQNNPQRQQELMAVNPRVVFFREMPATSPADSQDDKQGPVGAQGVALTAGRSIAVDPKSIPYGTPVWLATRGEPGVQKWVLAQDTGSAITGAVRADYFVGTGEAAGQAAGRMRQNLQMWALWPK
jgi:membrane-bound lytic murein transglycosylase A